MERVLYYLAVWFVLAVILNSENKFIVANGLGVVSYVFTDACQQIAYMVKQLS